MIEIEDIHETELEIYHQLRDSAFSADNSFIADSPKVVNMLLESDIVVKSILATREYYDEFSELVKSKNVAKVYEATKEQMQKIVGHKLHHNCMMHGIRPANSAIKDLGEKIIMLDEISSSENIGSIARSAAALGVCSYALAKKAPHPYQRRALRVSMGHISMLKTYIYDDIYQTIMSFKELGYRVFAGEVQEGSTPLMEVKVPNKWVLIMGHESKGISKEILEICDEVLTIEMQKGIKSFNVAVASSIIMYQLQSRG